MHLELIHPVHISVPRNLQEQKKGATFTCELF